ncbi:hypothetical protein [Undibacterium sp. Ji22W]|uniref:hypothetical protein n=1 Tax=Undibacterium sp. Ji22W TaxID=3413038 RepID=UPI003BF07355
MSFALGTAQRIRLSFAVLISYVLGIAAFAVVFPLDNFGFWSSYAPWIVGIPMCFAAYLSLEFLAMWALRLPMWQRLPAGAAVYVVVAVFALGIVSLLYFGDAHFTLEISESIQH